MRLDKFLQTSRIVKRRAVASELCGRGRVRVNGRPCKAGKELQVGDALSLQFRSGSVFECKILELPTRGIRKEEAAGLYETVNDTRSDGDRDS